MNWIYLLVKNNKVYKCRSLLDVADHFSWEIDEEGNVKIDGQVLTMTYNRDQYTINNIKIDTLKYNYLQNRLKVEVYKATESL